MGSFYVPIPYHVRIILGVPQPLCFPSVMLTNFSMWDRIDQASKVPTAAVKLNRDLTRDGRFDISDLETLIGHKVSHFSLCSVSQY